MWKAVAVVVAGGALSVAGFLGFFAGVHGGGRRQAVSVDAQVVQTARLAQQVATGPTPGVGVAQSAGGPAGSAPATGAAVSAPGSGPGSGPPASAPASAASAGSPAPGATSPSAPAAAPPSAPAGASVAEPPTTAELLRRFTYCAPGTSTPPPPAAGSYDAVVALGAGVLQRPDASVATLVGDDARTRVVGAYLAVARFGAARVLGFSGGHSEGDAAPSEAASYRQFLDSPAFASSFARGTARPAEVVLEERSKTTVENLAEIAKLASARGWRRLLLVTSYYHVPRVKYLVAEQKLAGADVAAAEPLVEAGLGDPSLHSAYCGWYQSPAGQLAVEREAAILIALEKSRR